MSSLMMETASIDPTMRRNTAKNLSVKNVESSSGSNSYIYEASASTRPTSAQYSTSIDVSLSDSDIGSSSVGSAGNPSESPPPSSASPYWAKVVSGSVGSVLTALAVTPLEVVKVRQQSSPGPISPPASTPSSSSKPMHFASGATRVFSVPSRSSASAAVNSSICSCFSFSKRDGVCSQLRRTTAKCYCSWNSSWPPKGRTFVLNNGLTDSVLLKSSVPYFDGRGKAVPPPATASPGTWKMLRRIFQMEGLAGLYAGLLPTLVMGVPSTVLYYSTYDEVMAKYRSVRTGPPSSIDAYVPALAGGAARLLASLATAPLELVRTRQASYGADRTMLQELRHVVESDGGFRGLYRGLSPTLWRDVPFSAVYWFALETMRSGDDDDEVPRTPYQEASRAFVHASFSGMIAAACTTPMDVLKTRRQVEADGAGSTASRLMRIAREEGVAALWRGNATRMIKVAPACAIMLSSYEFGKRALSGEAA